MARSIENRVKFCNVDVLAVMGDIVQKHTKHYQSDFEIDKKILQRAADMQEQQEKTFIWLCRTAGTWCLLERNVFLKGTRENNTFNFYAEQASDLVLAFSIEITGRIQESVRGNIYVLDYKSYYSHVCSTSLNAETVILKYEHGCRSQRADDRIYSYPDAEYGKLQFIQFQPHSQDELSGVLWNERQERKRFMVRNPNVYIAML